MAGIDDCGLEVLPSPPSRAQIRRTLRRHVALLALTVAVVIVPNVARFIASVLEGV